MNWLDIVILVALIIPTFLGLKRGLIVSLISLAGLILGIMLAGNYYKLLASMLTFIPSERAAGITAFIIILVIVLIVTAIIARILHKAASMVMLGWIDHIGGAIFGLFMGAILWGALLAIWVKFFGSGLVTQSFVASILLDNFPLVLTFLPDEFGGVRQFFH